MGKSFCQVLAKAFVVLRSCLWFYAQVCGFTLKSVVLRSSLWFYAQVCGFALKSVVLHSFLWFCAQFCGFALFENGHVET